MAYVAFQEIGGAAVGDARGPRPTHDVVPVGDAPFSPLEWAVMAIARRDGLDTVRPQGRVATVLRALRRRPNPRLADNRLEALRRMAVLTWRRGDAVPASELGAFLAAGFTPRQHGTLIRYVGAARTT